MSDETRIVMQQLPILCHRGTIYPSVTPSCEHPHHISSLSCTNSYMCTRCSTTHKSSLTGRYR